jgi:hypothetical protein
VLWSLATAWAARRRPRAAPRSPDFRAQTRGMGLRMSEWLRDRLRPGWLRLRPPSDDR